MSSLPSLLGNHAPHGKMYAHQEEAEDGDIEVEVAQDQMGHQEAEAEAEDKIADYLRRNQSTLPSLQWKQ